MTTEPTAQSPRFKPTHPFQKLLGFYKTRWEDGFARFELDLTPDHNNMAGIPHGGLYAAMLDSALGSAGVHMGNDVDVRPAVTLNLNVSFIGLPKGKRLIAEGRRVGGGKSVYFAEGEITDELGNCVARASGTFKYVKRP